MKKPKCKLPDIIQSSHLIGLTIAKLKEAGYMDQVHTFINEVKNKNSNFSYDEILVIAQKFVDFYTEE